MLAAAGDPLRRKPRKISAPVIDYTRRRSCRGPCAHHLGRLRQSKIEHRSQRRIKAEGLHSTRNQLSMLASKSRCRRACCIAAATACAEGMGASALRRRFTVPPSTSTQRTACRVQKPVASSSSARVWVASVMLRRKRMMPAGTHKLEPCALRPDNSVAAQPDHEKAPAPPCEDSLSSLSPSIPPSVLPEDLGPAAESASSRPPPRYGQQYVARAE